MAFNDLVEKMDTSLLTTFGDAAIFLPQTGEGPINITGIFAPPPELEQVLAGSSSGVTNIYFWVRFVDIAPNPRRGDVITITAVSYDIVDVLVDTAGGAVLKLKRNS